VNLLILSSHTILEYDDLRLFTDLGYDTFIPGSYTDPREANDTRPALPDAPHHPELAALCHEQRVKHADLGQTVDFGIVDWAKADLHPDLIDWADVIMVNCFPDTWISYQWDRIKHKRVIWRTIGQSNPRLEIEMRDFARQGMQVVRYSPAERRAFEPLHAFAGEDAMIRFAKYPADYGPWIGDNPVVGNITQNLDIRGDHCGLGFWTETTRDLPVQLAGVGSERMGGTGPLSYPDLLDYMAHLRCFLFLGTQPASYTLALMEVMLAGVPIVSIGPRNMWMPLLFEGHEIAVEWADHPNQAAEIIREYLVAPDHEASALIRERGVDLFGAEEIGEQWRKFLG